MAATITYTSGNRVNINGPYKEFFGTISPDTRVTYLSGEAPATTDSGRFILWCNGGTTNTSGWQIRRIVTATTNSITGHDSYLNSNGLSGTFRISTNIDDILAAAPTAGTKIGTGTYFISGDFNLSNSAFLASADENVEWARTGVDPVFPVNTTSCIQLGVLWGGENNNSKETTNGSRWHFRQTNSGNNSVYTTSNTFSNSGPVLNFYGSLIESSVGGGYLFQRMIGPARLIGCLYDGVMGGRFYSNQSEWVDCRHSGNDSATPAWSLGATFTRPIENIKFFKNEYAFKNFQTFSGTFRDCTFTNSNRVIARIEGTAGSVMELIDCTEFADDLISDSGSGIINQYRSINLTTTMANGTPLSGCVVRVNDVNDTTQNSILTSNISGNVSEILALRRRWTNASPSVTFYPYRIRIRKYGYYFSSSNTDLNDPIKQSTSLLVDPYVTENITAAQSHVGVSVIDHSGSPVSWNGKNWGITIVGNLSANPTLTLSNLKHNLHYKLTQNEPFDGKDSGLLWHNFIPMVGDETEVGSYGATTKGVRVITHTGDPFPGVLRMQADDETFYTPTQTYTLTLTDLISGSEIRAYIGTDPNTATEIASTESSLTTFDINHNGGDVAGFITIRKIDYKFIRLSFSYQNTNSEISILQEIDPWYNNP